MLLGELKENIPLVIIRPTIVTSTYKEPFPGWVEGVRYKYNYTNTKYNYTKDVLYPKLFLNNVLLERLGLLTA